MTSAERRLDGVKFIGMRKMFWLSLGARGWLYQLEDAKGLRRLRHYAWDSFRSYKDVTRHRRNWSEHRKVGKRNKKCPYRTLKGRLLIGP